jgi:membrane-associated protein
MALRPQFLVLVAAVSAVTAAAIFFNVYHYESAARLATANIGSFSSTLAWVKRAGYFFIFVAMVIEGPIITAAAAFAAALGYFNIFVIVALAVLGDLVGDVVYYYIGYFGRVRFVEKYGHHVGLTERRLKHLERLIRKHPKKTVTAIKLAPLLATPGLMMIGATRMPVVRYSAMAFLVALPKVALFSFLGFYFGHAYDRFSQIFESGEYFILIAIALTVVAFYAYKKISTAVANRLETI